MTRRSRIPPLLLLLLLALALAPGSAGAEVVRDAWEDTLERVVPAVAAIRVVAPRAFDDVSTGHSVATGFVVDRERGILLTNRHVVTPGPVVAEAVFQDHEEVELRAVYRDPVHDFGFFRFDPGDVRFMEVGELELRPERARVGAEIRVVGNDAGEKLSILAGTIARLDRAAPDYGRSGFNDFNTFYYQAASNTSGGSSGSPVVDRSGAVVALNAGGRRAASSSYYLPLDRVVRALEYVRRGEPVPRGTVQTLFRHLPYDELRRLGLRDETEAEARRRFSGGTGLVVVDEIVPGGPADGTLQIGDVVLRVEGEPVNAFLPLEAALDDNVGGTVMLDLERGGEPLRVVLPVADLHAITPHRFVEFGGGVFNTVSYHQARNHAVPVGGVYVASSGYALGRAGIPKAAVVTAVNGAPVPTLETFYDAIAALPHGTRAPLRWFSLADPRTERVSVVPVDRRWFRMRRCVRDDAAGRWPCTPAPPPPPAPHPEPATVDLPAEGERPMRALAPSMVFVENDIPYRIDGVHGARFEGAGLVVDAERGLVVVDRETVPVALGDLTLTFGASLEVPGEVAYLHPEHGLALVRYDPALLGETPVRSARLRPRALEPGDDVWLVGMSGRQRVVSRRTQVSAVEALTLPLTRPPRFRDANIELVALEDSANTVGGVLADDKGRVLALWASYSTGSERSLKSFFAGVPASHVAEMLERVAAPAPRPWRSLGVELGTLTLADARHRGLTAEQAKALADHDPGGRRVLAVERLRAGGPAEGLLEEGDLVLAVDGAPVTRFTEVEAAAQREDAVRVRVLRDAAERELRVPTESLDGLGTRRALLWAGALLQEPHRAIAAQRGIPPEGVYVSWYFYGSPADRYGLRATRRIHAVDGEPTPDLDAFVAAVASRPDRAPVRLHVRGLDGKEEVVTLELDLEFWPTTELVRGDDGWERRAVRSAPASRAASG